MAVSSTTNTEIYSGDGVTLSFSFPFYFFRLVDLYVYIYNKTTGVITSQTLGVDFNITATPDANGVYTSGGSVVFGTAPSNTKAIVISRFPIEQQNLSGSPLSDNSILLQFDYLTLLVQSLQDQVNRCARLPEGFGATFDPALPSTIGLVASENLVLVVNAAANGIALGPSITTILAAANAATSAAASAAAAAASASGASASQIAAAASALAAAASATAAAASAALAATSTPFQEIPAGSGVNFTVSQVVTAPNGFALFRNGRLIRQGVGQDYTISGNAVTLSTTLLPGEELIAAFSIVLGGTAGLVTAVANSANISLAAPAGVLTAALIAPVSGTSAAPVLVGSAVTIPLTTAAKQSKQYLKGNGGPVDMAVNPQIALGTADGQEVVIQGCSNSNTVRFHDGDGLSLNGDCILGLNDILTLTMDLAANVWVEKCRNN